jgi:hypothetical protein
MLDPLTQHLLETWDEGGVDTYPLVTRVYYLLPQGERLLPRLHNTCEVANLPIVFTPPTDPYEPTHLVVAPIAGARLLRRTGHALATHRINDACLLLWGHLVLRSEIAGKRAYGLRRLLGRIGAV